MSIISASTLTTTALQLTADTTGALVFKTGATPTTALTLAADQSATFAGTVNFATAGFTNLSISGVASFALGSVSAPSITFTGDTNTGIYSPAADTIAFTEGGVEAMRIDSSGNVLVGTATAQELLTVNKNAAFGTTADAFSEIRFFNSTATSGTTRVRATAGALAFLTSNAEAMRIDASQNVGIGTASPDIFGRGYARILGVSSATANGAIELNSATGNGSFIDMGVNAVRLFTIYSDASSSGLNTNTALPLYFATNNAERMRISSAGDVAIGTTVTAFDTGSGLRIQRDNAPATIRLVQNGSGGSAFEISAASSNAQLDYRTGALLFLSAGTERMRINAGAPILCLSGGSTTATGTGIAFPATQSASSDANTLDDYEEGTWTPTISTGITSPTYSRQVGRYTKIGNLVHVQLSIETSGGTRNANSLVIGGLPFTQGSFNGGVGYSFGYTNSGFVNSTTNNLPTIYGDETTVNISFYKTTGAGFVGNDLQSASFRVDITGSYLT
jgi:hypothetical protein